MTDFFSDKIIAVTGGGGVLCGTIAAGLAKRGARIALVNRREETAAPVAEEIRDCGGEARIYRCDVLRKEELAAAHEAIDRDMGKVDILINGAGGNANEANTTEEFFEGILSRASEGGRTFFDLEEADIRRVFDVNCMGTLLASQVFVPDMIGRSGCCVLNISSITGTIPLTKTTAYSQAKAAVDSLTKWMAVYFSKAGIRVNALTPGFFSTRQNRDLLWNADGTPTERTGKILGKTPMGRLGRPEELMGCVEFLLDDTKASYVTGAVIPVDGGFLAYSGV